MNELSFFPALLKMFFALAIVIGLLMATMYVLRRYLNHSPSGSRDDSLIKIVSSRYLGPKCSILMVEVLGKIIVMGLSNGQMTVLATIDDDRSLEKIHTARENEMHKPILADRLKRYSDMMKPLARDQKVGHKWCRTVGK
ncbi:MAG: flagellar biosynthetic protein FliO, partial [Syntrophales bacterium LBB04]|nr:flagellar biosynthetic protein FliO [Syntrophales bacterium LBB04]